MGLAVILTYIALALLSPGELIPDLAPLRPMIFLAFIGFVSALLDRMRAPEVGKLRVQFALVLAFFGYACVAWFPHGALGANLNTFLQLAPNIIAYFLGVVQMRSPQRLSFARAMLVGVALFIMFNALLEVPEARATGTEQPYVMIQNFLSLSGSIIDTGVRIRGLGVLKDPNNFGQFLLLILPLLYVSKKDRGMGLGWLPALGITAIFLVGVYFTGSRGAIVGLASMLGLFLIRRFKTRGAIIATGFGSAALLVVQGYRGTGVSISGGMDRLAIWSDGLNYFKYNPIVGIGPFNFANKQGMTAHNSFLLVAAEMGLIGFFLWLAMIVVTWIQLDRIPKVVAATNPALGRWAIALRLSLGGYMFTSFFLSRAYDLPLFVLLGMSGGLIVAAGGDDAIPLRGTNWPFITLGLCTGILVMIYIMLRLRAA